LISLGWNYFKMLLEVVERYIVVGVLCYTSPLAFAMGGSKTTNQVFKSWCWVGSEAAEPGAPAVCSVEARQLQAAQVRPEGLRQGLRPNSSPAALYMTRLLKAVPVWGLAAASVL